MVIRITEKIPNLPGNLGNFFFCFLVNSITIKVFEFADSDFHGFSIIRIRVFLINSEKSNLPANFNLFIFTIYVVFEFKYGRWFRLFSFPVIPNYQTFGIYWIPGKYWNKLYFFCSSLSIILIKVVYVDGSEFFGLESSRLWLFW